MKEKHELGQIAVASALGAVAGISVAIALGQVYLCWVGAIIGGLVGFVCCEPQEVPRIARKVVKKRFENLVYSDNFFPTFQRCWLNFNNWIKEYYQDMIFISFVVIIMGFLPLIALTKLYVFVLEQNYAAFILSSSFLSFFVCLSGYYIANDCSTKCKITMPLERLLNIYFDFAIKYESENDIDLTWQSDGYFFSFERFFTLLKISCWSVFMPFICFLVWPVALIDLVISAFLLLAVTKRLSAMAGAFTGTIIGSLLYYLNALPVVSVFTVGIAMAITIGVGSYVLREALISKAKQRFAIA